MPEFTHSSTTEGQAFTSSAQEASTGVPCSLLSYTHSQQSSSDFAQESGSSASSHATGNRFSPEDGTLDGTLDKLIKSNRRAKRWPSGYTLYRLWRLEHLTTVEDLNARNSLVDQLWTFESEQTRQFFRDQADRLKANDEEQHSNSELSYTHNPPSSGEFAQGSGSRVERGNDRDGPTLRWSNVIAAPQAPAPENPPSQLPSAPFVDFAADNLSPSSEPAQDSGSDATGCLFVPEHCILDGTKLKPTTGFLNKNGNIKRPENSFFLYKTWKQTQLPVDLDRKFSKNHLSQLWKEEPEEVRQFFRNMAHRKKAHRDWEFPDETYQPGQKTMEEERPTEQQTCEVPSTVPTTVIIEANALSLPPADAPMAGYPSDLNFPAQDDRDATTSAYLSVPVTISTEADAVSSPPADTPMAIYPTDLTFLAQDDRDATASPNLSGPVTFYTGADAFASPPADTPMAGYPSGLAYPAQDDRDATTLANLSEPAAVCEPALSPPYVFTESHSQLDSGSEGSSGLQRGSAKAESRAQRAHNPYPQNGRTRVADTVSDEPVVYTDSFSHEPTSESTIDLQLVEDMIAYLCDFFSRFSKTHNR
ncbi:hypothetical protein EST38_g9178 [Candolleomyces aberdarensis]|uniref:HMG box domain-containing protein n=1 Tax=Candolleomyces aberdarensis TaxID=2316362 RepID=A0A4Q2DCX5_9AGAR|nr:hypothetical protein EST38_g9178 [Candolleomyces aberdarensis]